MAVRHLRDNKFVEIDLRKRFFAHGDRLNLPAYTVIGPLSIPKMDARWGFFLLRIRGAGKFFAPQLIIGSEDPDEQNIAISLKLVHKYRDGSTDFGATVSRQRLEKPLFLIPSLRNCQIQALEVSASPLSRRRAALSMARELAVHPRLVSNAMTKGGVGNSVSVARSSAGLGGSIKTVIELATRNVPNPKSLTSGKDSDYSSWLDSKFEMLIPRSKIEVPRISFPLSVVIVSGQHEIDLPLSLTLNSLYSAGLTREQIFVAGNISNFPKSLNKVKPDNVLDALGSLEGRGLVLCLNAGDTVARDFLTTLDSHINQEDYGFIYFDHDHTASDGTFHDFEFKPDNSPNTLLFRNFPSRAGVVRLSDLTRLVDEYPAVRDADLTALIYGCAIRASQQEGRVLHIPVPSIHLSVDSKRPAESEGQVRDAILRHLAPNLIIDPPGPSGARWHAITSSNATVSIVIPTKNRLNLLKAAIESIREITDYPSYEIVVIDNESNDIDTLSYLRRISDEGIARTQSFSEPFNFARMYNQVAPGIESKFMLLLNNDTQVTRSTWLTRMVDLFELPNIGIVGNKLVYPDNTIQHIGTTGGLRGPMSHHLVGVKDSASDPIISNPRDVLAVTGACLLIPTDLYLANGGMDERLAVSYNDMDLCLSIRLKMGKAVLVSSSGGVIHKESKSRGTNFDRRQQALLDEEAGYFEEKWGGNIRPDPFYNLNLSLRKDFTLQ